MQEVEACFKAEAVGLAQLSESENTVLIIFNVIYLKND